MSEPIEILPAGERSVFEDDRRAVERLKLQAAQFTIRDLATETEANEALLGVKGKYRAIDAAYHRIIDPLDESKKAAKALFEPVLAALVAIEFGIKTKIGEWKLAEKNRIEREQREAREAAERIQKEIAAQAKKNPGAPVALVKPKVVPPLERSYSGAGGATNTRFEWDYEVEDLGKLYKAAPELVKMEVRRQAILDRLKATNGKAIPGLKIVEKPHVMGKL